jgi:hypothetical protein
LLKRLSPSKNQRVFCWRPNEDIEIDNTFLILDVDSIYNIGSFEITYLLNHISNNYTVISLISDTYEDKRMESFCKEEIDHTTYWLVD